MTGGDTRGGERAWQFLKRNPAFVEAHGGARSAAPEEAAPFPMRSRTEADRDAAAWGLLAWEDPLDGASSPFWTDAPAVMGLPAPGAPPLAAMLAEPGVRLRGLRIAGGPAIVKVERDGAAVHVRFEDGEAFDPGAGVVYCFADGLELAHRLRRAADLWPIAGGGIKKDAAAGSASRTTSC